MQNEKGENVEDIFYSSSEIYGDPLPDKIPTTEEAVKDVEAIVLVTRWKEFEKLPQILREAKTQPVVVDGRECWTRIQS